MVVAWPERIPANSGLRSQFTHCIDIGPTILEVAGIPQAQVVDGIEQEPMHGTSFAYTFDDAEAPEQHTVQYFETFANRAIYQDGWWACAKLDRIPWDGTPETIARFAPGVYDPEQDVWELYYLPDDFSQGQRPRGRAPREARRAQGAVLGRGREVPGAAAAQRAVHLLRHPPAVAHGHPARRSTATWRTSPPA